MNKATLEESISEALRFIERADEAITRMKADKYALISGSKETAAVKRASMDLSRVLSEVRE